MQRAIRTGRLGAGLILAATAAAQEPFTEESSARGIHYVVTQGVVDHGFGCGVALADLDADGDADLIGVGAADGHVALYENDGTGHFTDRESGSGLPAVLNASGVSAADWDADGDMDLYFTRWNTPNVMMRNEGDFQFVDVSVETGTADDGAGTGCTWGDYDQDGRLDLYLCNRTGSQGSTVPNRLFRNRGQGVFVDEAFDAGVTGEDSWSFHAVFFDYDQDADLDLYLSNDKGYAGLWTNRLYQNLGGGAFLDVSSSSGADAKLNSMGIAVGDFDGNGWDDFYVTNTHEGNELYLNDGDGTFTDSTLLTGTGSYLVGWGAVFVDYDNDGWRELFVCNMDGRNRLYDHDGTWPCVNDAQALQLGDPEASFGVAAADVDADGDVDLVTQNLNGRVKLWINHEGENRSWVRFRVDGPDGNPEALGARVGVRVGATTQTHGIVAGAGYKGLCEHVAHFGLDQATVVDQVDVAWPGGAVTRTLTGYAAGSEWTLYPPERLGDADGDGAVGPLDLGHFWLGYTGPGIARVRPGWEMMDFDGDGDVDADDYASFLTLYALPARAWGSH